MTVSSFAKRHELAVNQTAEDRQQTALDQATDLIRGAVGQHVTRGTSTVVLTGCGRRLLQLPEAPVVAVTAVTVAGQPLVGAVDFDVVGVGDRRGAYLARRGPWGWATGSQITVTYTHGYEAIPDDLARVCAELAGRIIDGSIRLRSQQESIGNRQRSVTYAASSDATFDPAEEAVLDRYRLIPLP